MKIRVKRSAKASDLKLKLSKRLSYTSIIIAGLVILSLMIYSTYKGKGVAERYAPLADALMEVKVKATTAHLWLEELITGDKSIDLQEIWNLLDKAEWYANAALSGAKSSTVTYLPIDDPGIRHQIKTVIDELKNIRTIALKRLDEKQLAYSGIGSAVDQELDRIFKRFSENIDQVVVQFKILIRKELKDFVTVQLILIFFSIVLVTFVLIIIFNTEKKRSQALNDLVKSETKFRQLFENMEQGMALHRIVVKDNKPVDYIFLDINKAFTKLTGLSRELVIGKKVTKALPGIEKDPANWIQKYGKVAQTGVPLIFENFAQPLNKWYSVVAYSPQKNQFATVVSDITSRKNFESEREKLIKDLRAKNKELEQFTYTVSHDLKSPLITIKGFLSILSEDIVAGKTANSSEDIKRIQAAADKMSSLLDDLLELSRIGRIMNPEVKIDLNGLIKEVLELLSGPVISSHIKVGVQEGFPSVTGDRQRIAEIFQNLIENGIKFMGNQKSPAIEIGYEKTGDQLRFFVRDNGIGIDPKYHDKVFELFDKLDQESEGTGVGLALVKQIIEVHNGRIWIESSGNGQGTTFYFTLNEQQQED